MLSGGPVCLLPSLFLLSKYSLLCRKYVTAQKVARNNELKRFVKARFEIAIALHIRQQNILSALQ